MLYYDYIFTPCTGNFFFYYRHLTREKKGDNKARREYKN